MIANCVLTVELPYLHYERLAAQRIRHNFAQSVLAKEWKTLSRLYNAYKRSKRFIHIQHFPETTAIHLNRELILFSLFIPAQQGPATRGPLRLELLDK